MLLLAACNKDKSTVPGDLQNRLGYNDSHWMADSVRSTGTTRSGGQNVPYTFVTIRPMRFEFHASATQVVVVELDDTGRTLNRTPCGYWTDSSDREVRIGASYTAPNRYDVIENSENTQHWRMTQAKNPGLTYTEDYYLRRKP